MGLKTKINFNKKDIGSSVSCNGVCLTIEKIYKLHNDEYSFIFANGGDQNNKTIPEKKICDTLGIKLVDGMGSKIQSSSWLLKNQ